MEIRWSLPAAEDLERICESIERDNPEAARRVAQPQDLEELVAVVGAAMPDNLDHGPDYDTWQWVTTPRSDSGDPAHLLPLSLGIADTVPCGGARSKKQALGYQYAPYGIMVATCKANSIGL